VSHEVAYRIVETLNQGERLFEVWGNNEATGLQWQVGVYDTRARAEELVKHWKETAS
jgi:hypothetical protein